MFNSKLTKEEMIDRIIKERDMYLYNAECCKKNGDKVGEKNYRDRARDIDTLMIVLEIREA